MMLRMRSAFQISSTIIATISQAQVLWLLILDSLTARRVANECWNKQLYGNYALAECMFYRRRCSGSWCRIR